jgi:hypothetical protein
MFISASSSEVSDTNVKYFISTKHFNFKTILQILLLCSMNALTGCCDVEWLRWGGGWRSDTDVPRFTMILEPFHPNFF